jgi:hypothetical protein
MAITRKPKSPAPASTIDVEALINKGGTAPKQIPDRDATVTVMLRLPAPLAEQIDAFLKAKPIRIPRHTWILQTLHDKLAEETKI